MMRPSCCQPLIPAPLPLLSLDTPPLNIYPERPLKKSEVSMKNILKNKITLFFSFALVTLGLMTPPVFSAAAGPKAEAATAKKTASFKVAFDLSHNEIFSPENTGRLHYSTFYKGFKDAGAKAGVNMRTITPEIMKDLDAYVIAGPASPFITPEIIALQGFVHDGGSLLVLLHISAPVARLTESFGIIVSNFVVSEKKNTIEGRSQDFYVTDISASPVTLGLKKIALYGTWALLPERGAEAVAKTSKEAWADLNRNRKKDKDEPTDSFAIVAVKKFGSGRVVVVADDAPFANAFINVGDNARLSRNIIKWFKANPVKR